MSEEISEVSASREVLNITLLAGGWTSSAGGLATFNRELAIHLSQHPKVEVSFLVPDGHCTDEEKSEARSYGIAVVDAKKRPGWKPLDWLSAPPRDHKIDVVIGHGAKLGCQVPLIRESDRYHNCKWVQVVHTDPEDLSKYKGYSNPTSRGQEKHEVEVDLCKLADLVVPVGPRLEERYSSYLKRSKRDIFPLIPGLFARDFGDLEQFPNENAEFKVLLCGRGDEEDFEVKGYNLAVEAFADHRLQMKPYHLLFVGAPEGEQDEVRQRLLQYGIAKEQLTVRKFEQSRDKMKDLLCEVNLAIMPSRSEGFGLVALEALSAGLPILVNSKSGFARALENIPLGKSCILESDEPAKWAEAIEDVCGRHRVRLKEIKLLRSAYDDTYSWKEQCEALVENMRGIVYGSSDVGITEMPREEVIPVATFLSNSSVQVERRKSTGDSTSDADAFLVVQLKFQIQDLSVNQQGIVNEILAQQIQVYTSHNDLSTPEGVGALLEFIKKAYNLALETVGLGCLEIAVQCPSLESLENLWSEYCSGHLNEVAERLLVTDDLKRKLGRETVRIKTTIEEENYLRCKRALTEMSVVAGSAQSPSEETKPDEGEDGGGTGTSPDDQQDKENQTSWMITVEKAKASRTALHKASISGEYETVKMLLDSGEDVDKKDQFALTPLHLACSYGQESVARLLLEYGADANAFDRFSLTPLHLACWYGHETVARLLLEHDADADALDRFFRTPLHLACWCGQETVVRLLLEHFADADAVDRFFLTPLHLACLYGQESVVRQLLEHGANPNAVEMDKNINSQVFIGFILSFEDVGKDISWMFTRETAKASRSALHKASSSGEYETVKMLLDSGEDVDKRDQFTLTPLHLACSYGQASVARLLLEQGADANASDRFSLAPLHLACFFGLASVFRLLLERRVTTKVLDRFTLTPLHLACSYGQESVARLLLEQGSDASASDKFERTPLPKAKHNDHQSVIQLLLEYKASASFQQPELEQEMNWIIRGVKAKTSRTALHKASINGQYEAVKMLLDSGADVDKRDQESVAGLLLERGADANVLDRFERTPLQKAERNKHQSIVQLLLENNASPSFQQPLTLKTLARKASLRLDRAMVAIEQALNKLHSSAKNDDVEKVVELVLNDGVDINFPAENNLTPLMCASQSSSSKLIQALIDLGADINVQSTDDNATSLLLAAGCNHYMATHLLLEHGADANTQDFNGERGLPSIEGNTALHKSALGGFFNTSQLLIESGCNINQQNGNKETPLHIAVEKNNEALVKLLLEKKVDVNIRDKKGNTALHRSARGGFLNISQLLIASGCNVNQENDNGETALYTAVEKNRESVVKLLLENNADGNIHRFEGDTAMHKAVLTNVFDILLLLIKSGCNINQRNHYFETPLLVAVKRNIEPLVKLLLENKANVNIQDRSENKALHIAVSEGLFNISQLLIQSGCDVNQQNRENDTLLHIAVKKNHEPVTKLLLENDADVNIQGPGRDTALHIAVREGFFSISKLLIDSGCYINLRNCENKTPLSIAAGKNFWTLVNLLHERNAEGDVQEAQ